MSLTIAVERLYDTGWSFFGEGDLDHLPDGRPFPSVLAIQREFALAGLELTIKRNLMFDCFHGKWAPAGEPLEPQRVADDRHGAVVGACEREAAVYALAQLRLAQSCRFLASV